MPITITPPTPAGIGPGLFVSFTSDFVGPLPTGSSFVMQLYPQGHENAIVADGVVVTQDKLSQTTVGLPDNAWSWNWVGFGSIQAGQPCTIAVTLNEPGNQTPIDSGAITVPWDPGTGLPALLQAQGQGGLTAQQAQQLQELHQANWPILSLDGLALTSLTGGIPTDSLSAGLASSLNGVIVRIAQIPDNLTPIQGDPNYWRQTLAQVSIYRSNDLWLRFPVHSQARMFLLPGSEVASGIASQDLTAWLLNMHLVLTTYPGVLAEVFLMHTP